MITKNNLDGRNTNRRINETSFIKVMEHLHKRNNNYINIIISQKERTKTPFWKLAINKDEEKEYETEYTDYGRYNNLEIQEKNHFKR